MVTRLRPGGGSLCHIGRRACSPGPEKVTWGGPSTEAPIALINCQKSGRQPRVRLRRQGWTSDWYGSHSPQGFYFWLSAVGTGGGTSEQP